MIAASAQTLDLGQHIQRKISKEGRLVSAVKVNIVNAFVSDGKGGNAAGVVLHADGMSEAEMQAVAAEVGVSETAFVSSSTTAAFKLSFFTPNRRIPHCGHATIATFTYMASLGMVAEGYTSKETVDGIRRVLIQKGAAYMEQTAPIYHRLDECNGANVRLIDVLNSLSLHPDQVYDTLHPLIVDTGNRFLLVGLCSGDSLRSVNPDFEQINRISEDLNVVGYYLFTTDKAATGCQATTRMFAPRFAIREESATGMAAGTLASLLYDHIGMKASQFLIEQGCFMVSRSPSLLTVNLDLMNDQIRGLMVGGHGRFDMTRMVYL